METIAAAAVAILGTWLLWPCLLATVLLLGVGAVFGVAFFLDWRDARRELKSKEERARKLAAERESAERKRMS